MITVHIYTNVFFVMTFLEQIVDAALESMKQNKSNDLEVSDLQTET